MNMNAAGIAVSKRKSMFSILRPGREAVAKPFGISHLSGDIQLLFNRIHSLDGESRVVMECTGRYYKPIVHEDGWQKWVGFAAAYWHVDCARKMSLNAFVGYYQKWRLRKKYNFRRAKAEENHGTAKELVPVLLKGGFTKQIIKQLNNYTLLPRLPNSFAPS